MNMSSISSAKKPQASAAKPQASAAKPPQKPQAKPSIFSK